MKNHLFYLILSFPLPMMSQSFQGEFTPLWGRAKAYFVEVAEAMPESEYNFRPTQEEMSFKEQIVHVSGNLYSLSARFIEGKPSSFQRPDVDTLSKMEAIGLVQGAFNRVDAILLSASPEQLSEIAKDFWSPDPTPRKGIFYLMRDHLTHHRAQMIVYLRLKGIKPPGYRGW